MRKTLALLAATSALTLSVALAQSPPSTSSTPSAPPAATTPAAPSGAMNKSDKSAMSTTAPAKTPTTIGSQKSDEWLASRFKGTEVIGPDDAKIGSVSDILFDRSGTVKAVIVGVGGFLGIGSKDVAMSLDSFQIVPAPQNSTAEKLKVAMTKDQLASAEEFKPYEPPKPAASTAPSSPTAPAPRTQ